MIRTISILLCTIFALAVEAAPADPFKTAKAAIKAKNNLEAAEKGLVDYAASSATKPSERARAYNMAAQVTRRIFDVENEKYYLKQKFDTVRYFSAIQRLYQHTVRCDSICNEPDEQGRVRAPYAKENRKLRTTLRTNLLEGGKWMMRSRRYAEAARYFDMFCTTDTDLQTKDARRDQIAVWTAKCAYAVSDMPLALRYVDAALATGTETATLLEYKARALYATGDTVAWERTLVEGMERCPEHLYFFVSMHSRLRAQHRYEEALGWSSRMIGLLPDTILFRYARSLVYHEMRDWDKCIEASQDVIARDADHAEAQFNLGTAWLGKAAAFAVTACYDAKSEQFRKDRAQLIQMYQNAKAPLETFRRLRPNDRAVWGPLLYKVYYTLNMGEELEEIERLGIGNRE